MKEKNGIHLSVRRSDDGVSNLYRRDAQIGCYDAGSDGVSFIFDPATASQRLRICTRRTTMNLFGCSCFLSTCAYLVPSPLFLFLLSVRLDMFDASPFLCSVVPSYLQSPPFSVKLMHPFSDLVTSSLYQCCFLSRSLFQSTFTHDMLLSQEHKRTATALRAVPFDISVRSLNELHVVRERLGVVLDSSSYAAGNLSLLMSTTISPTFIHRVTSQTTLRVQQQG